MTARTGSRPVSALDIADHLKIDQSMISGDFKTYIESLIDTAILVGEKYSSLVFRETTFTGYLDYFVNGCSYEIRRAPLQSISYIGRTVSGVATEFYSSNFYVVSSSGFSRVALAVGSSWPTDQDRIYHAVQVDFVAGYADGECPVDIQHAIKLHVAAMYVNRGDCDKPGSKGGTSVCDAECALPIQAKNIYSQNDPTKGELRIGL